MAIDHSRLDRVVLEARKARDERDKGYRERALKIYPWICGRCAREFTHSNLRELTVHHRDHNHDNNPPDGSNWELLCLYCHDNEHQKQLELAQRGVGGPGGGGRSGGGATHSPFAALQGLLKGNKPADS
ncbi:YajD family HNH nuclease [Rhodocyclus tenuis]|uniref:YajD family HNH nuclease n=1 Tax=Rhodocyclus tenuis TaxID=1066 RepID=UPI0019055DE9|nr:YajD family HNH nuclease [Rhodocyclus tenuis]MBK1681385.1 HNH endonuclease [Rhodocyclus tenuis]